MTNQNQDAANLIYREKYLQQGEQFEEGMTRIAGALQDDEQHFRRFRDILLEQRFLPAGRIQTAVGAARSTTPYNCYVSGTIDDSMEGICERLTQALQTMRLGGGIGYDFSTLRPAGERIRSLDSSSCGPVGDQHRSRGFMDLYDAACSVISSAGHRRGAQMAVLRVDHPDIRYFIRAKRQAGRLTNFNVSVGITDEFMEAVCEDKEFDLKFAGRIYETIRARNLWDEIMRSTWDYAEPGVLFLDTINRKNNLWYCEEIAATNPCLHPDSLIETIDGRVRIADITEPTIVYTMNEDGSLGTARASSSWVSKKNARTLKIKVRSGKEITCTPDHKIFVDGKGWTEAKNLRVGDPLVHLCRARRGAAYSGIKLTTEENRAYRMEHRFVAEAAYGPLTDDEDVHHIDGDTYNNSIDNFEILPHNEHSTLTRYSCENNHQVSGYFENGLYGFLPTGRQPKPIVPMPEALKSNLKNHRGACVVSIEEGPVTDVYDITVEGTHNLISDFIVVHNCGEQPLPPFGACLLGSFNLTKYLYDEYVGIADVIYRFNWDKFKADIPDTVRAMDNVIDNAIYPLPEQAAEAKNKRRMGLGITGLANTAEVLGKPYGSKEMLAFTEQVMTTLRDYAYLSSVDLAKEKGAFPLYEVDQYVGDYSNFAGQLPYEIQLEIEEHGIRNSHLLSIAPTGTISLAAGNISSGIEPPYTLGQYTRNVYNADGSISGFNLMDYAELNYGVRGVTSQDCKLADHVEVLNLCSRYVDSSVSKTCNVGPDVTFHEFKDVYREAYEGGASGITTFRPVEYGGKREGIFSQTTYIWEEEGQACTIDEMGQRSCDV